MAETYVFSAPVTKELKEHIMTQSRQQLATILGVDVDDVMAGYVATMVANKKTMAQIAQSLLDFIGEDSAAAFVAWLGGTFLPLLEAPSTPDTTSSNEPSFNANANANDPSSNANEPSSNANANANAPAKRVISLKGISSTNSSGPPGLDMALSDRKRSSSTGTTSVRSLQGNAAGGKGKDMRDVLARRSQRFGMPEKPASPVQGTKRRASDRDREQTQDQNLDQDLDRDRDPDQDQDQDDVDMDTSGNERTRRRPSSAGGRLAQRLGPPVNRPEPGSGSGSGSDKQDANKRRRTNSNGRDRDRARDREPERERSRTDGDDRTAQRSRNRSQERETNDRRGERERGPSDRRAPRRGNAAGHAGDAPPLPPDDDVRGKDDRRKDASGSRNAPPPHGYGRFPGAPPGFPGYPMPGFGPPPMGFYPPPPYGPMPPYDMGFAHHSRGPYMPPPPVPPTSAPKPYQVGPRGLRGGFQNKKWVNPQAAAQAGEDTEAASTGETAAAPNAGAAPPALNARAAPFQPPPQSQPQLQPRNPFFSSQLRPRFQNKTWVRPEAAAADASADPAVEAAKEAQLDASLPSTPPQDMS